MRLQQVFQFHKGTIKTSISRIKKRLIARFQFHKGTIKTPHRLLSYMILSYFNSIKVRLKPISLYSDMASKQFQFHKGTIKTYVL